MSLGAGHVWRTVKKDHHGEYIECVSCGKTRLFWSLSDKRQRRRFARINRHARSEPGLARMFGNGPIGTCTGPKASKVSPQLPRATRCASGIIIVTGYLPVVVEDPMFLPEGAAVHLVGVGETLSWIADLYGTTTEALIVLNQRDKYNRTRPLVRLRSGKLVFKSLMEGESLRVR